MPPGQMLPPEIKGLPPCRVLRPEISIFLNRINELLERSPHPPLRQFGQVGGVGRGGFFVFALAFPLAAAGFEDALQELLAGFVAAAFAAGEFGFGFDEAAFDGGFEDGGFVALEVGLDALEVGDGFVEAGELFFDFRDDAFLLVEGCERKWSNRWNCSLVNYGNVS